MSTPEQKEVPKPVLEQPKTLPTKAPSEIVVEKGPETEVIAADPKGKLPEGKKLPQDRVPSNWNILPTDVDGVIHATNIITGKVFQGGHKELGKYMREE